MELKEKILHGTRKSLETIGIDKLKEIIHKSEKEKREYALLFCGNTDIPPFGDISHSNLCTGTECRVILKDCKGKIQIGSFHTHHHTGYSKDEFIEHLSDEDIYSTISNKRNFSCIGFIEDKKSQKNLKPVIKCFIPALDIQKPIIALESYIAEDKYHKKLLEYNLSENKPDGTKKSLDELLKELSEDKRKILSDTYTRWTIADDELYKESELLFKKLLHKDADLTIR